MEIKFGTGGVRGVMGDAPGCINSQVIRRVTQGLAEYILLSDAPRSAGVAYDTRHNSEEFAQAVCDVLSAFGIEVYVFNKPMPTPALSYAIRSMSLGWGVVITASHNPQEYNGYKVYDKNGVQVTDQTAAGILASINALDESGQIPEKQQELIGTFDTKIEEEYFKQIISFVTTSYALPYSLAPYPFVYSALHGAGANAVPIVLERLGFSPICIQQNPDGAFGGLKTPNPEEPVVYEKALAEAEKTGAKQLLATDPDCDRVGVMAKTGNGFEMLSGNQIGALLIDYLAQTRGVNKGDTVISTIVSGQLGELVSRDYGLEFVRLLTGFKYIGEFIVNLPENKRFFFGYEESYGFLAGDGARDKDAVIASALIVKMAAYYEEKGKTLFDRLDELSDKHGYCQESLHSVEASQDKQKEIMDRQRSGNAVKCVEGTVPMTSSRVEDYLPGLNGLPPSDVIKLYFANTGNKLYNNAWAAIRPSGTEPKLKLYTGVHADTLEKAQESLCILKNELLNAIGETL